MVEKDVQVSVEAKRDADAGIVLNYQNDRNYLLAYYNPSGLEHDQQSEGRTIRFHEMVDGRFRPAQKVTTLQDLGPDLELMAQIKGSQADFTLTDGTTVATVSHAIEDLHQVGGVGLYSLVGELGVNVNLAVTLGGYHKQSYDNFRVIGEGGKPILEDPFNQRDGPVAGWQISPLPVNYRFYLRDHLHRDKAPMVNKVRFASTAHIKP